MNTTILKQRVINKTIESSSDDLLMEELKGYIYSKVYEEDEREELGDEEEDNDNDERKELGDDEDDDFEEEDDSDYDDDDDLEEDNEDEIDEDEDDY